MSKDAVSQDMFRGDLLSCPDMIETARSKEIPIGNSVDAQIELILCENSLCIKDLLRHQEYSIALPSEQVTILKNAIHLQVDHLIQREYFEKNDDIVEIVSIRGNTLNGACITYLESRLPENREWIDMFSKAERTYFGYSCEDEKVYFAKHAQKFLDFQEGLEKVKGLIAEFEEKELSDIGKTLLLLVGGPSGGGKTKLTKALFKHYEDKTIELSTDNFYKGKEQMFKEDVCIENEPDFDNPNAIDFEQYVRCLVELLDGKDVLQPEYDFVTSQRITGTKELKAKRYVFGEGIFDLRDDFVPSECDIPNTKIIRVAVVVELFELLIRRIRRDMNRKNGSPIKILQYIKKFVEPSYKKYIMNSLHSADIHIKNTYNPDHDPY